MKTRPEHITTASADLQVHADHDGREPLGLFEFHDQGLTESAWGPRLPRLGGDCTHEAWCGPGPLAHTSVGACHIRRGQDMSMFALHLPDDGTLDVATLAETAYDQLLSAPLGGEDWQIVRLWNYLPFINLGDGDAERYRQFCIGRSAALARAGYLESRLCAATAIGSRDSHLRIYGLATRAAALHIENPRQLNAWRYPPRYGPASPSFARATAVARPDGSWGLMVSGTASVIGHATVHVGNLDAQLAQTIDNLDVLLATAATRLQRPALARFDARSILRVYLRDPSAWEQIQPRLREAWPDSRLVALAGDICRRDLDVEIEAWHCG